MSAPAMVVPDHQPHEHPAAAASAAAGPTPPVLDLVRGELATADAAGQRRPGRPRLVRQLAARGHQVTDHQIKLALARLATEPTSPPPPAAPLVAETPAVTTGEIAPLVPPSPLAAAPVVASSSPRQTELDELPSAGPAARQPTPWPLLVIGLAAAVAVWGGWVDLGAMTGFGIVHPLPGVWDTLTINSAIVLPLGIEAYGAYSLRIWFSSAELATRTRRFAAWSAIASLVVGAAAQVASHLMRADGITRAPTLVTMLVACVPVAVLGLATGLATLVRRDAALAKGGQS
jgi:hypothetical protein